MSDLNSKIEAILENDKFKSFNYPLLKVMIRLIDVSESLLADLKGNPNEELKNLIIEMINNNLEIVQGTLKPD